MQGELALGKPRTTGLRPWLWGTALAGSPEHSPPRLRTGRSVVRGKPILPEQAFARSHFILVIHFRLKGESGCRKDP